MDDFVSISLETTECDICHQDTGEELISCVLNDRYLRESENLKSSCSGNLVRAHAKCLQKWESVVKTAIKPLAHQVKRTWKDRIKGLVNTVPDRRDSRETWAPIKQDEQTNEARQQGTTSFLLTRETYRVESLCKDENRTRGRKVRIKSIEIDDEEDDKKDSAESTTKTQTSKKPGRTTEDLHSLDVAELRIIVSNLQQEINEVSADLVNQLQERDTLIQQGDTMRVTVGKLIDLQKNVKNASTLSGATSRISQVGSVIL